MTQQQLARLWNRSESPVLTMDFAFDEAGAPERAAAQWISGHGWLVQEISFQRRYAFRFVAVDAEELVELLEAATAFGPDEVCCAASGEIRSLHR